MKIFFATSATKQHWEILDRCKARNRLMSYYYLNEAKIVEYLSRGLSSTDEGEQDETKITRTTECTESG